MYCGIRKLIRSILAFHDDTGCNHAAMVIAAYLQRGKFTLSTRPQPEYRFQAQSNRQKPVQRVFVVPCSSNPSVEPGFKLF